jgi:MFS family permease
MARTSLAAAGGAALPGAGRGMAANRYAPFPLDRDDGVGAGGCAGMVLSPAIVRDLFDRGRAARTLATISIAMTLAPSLSPAIGAYPAE